MGPQMLRTISAEPIAVKGRTVAQMLDTSISTVRRLHLGDPDFPKPFRLTPQGDWLWLTTEIRAYLAHKAGRQLAA
jgi:predicted DNA-binding transcriptional regulator AlpA